MSEYETISAPLKETEVGGVTASGPLGREIAPDPPVRGAPVASVNPLLEPIKIILVPLSRHGRSSAALPDGTLLVASSRQPFLDSARVLIAWGYDPASCLEGWWEGGSSFALRGRLGIAAGLTVDETRTIFAPWKPFSLSAVSASIRQRGRRLSYPVSPSNVLRDVGDQAPRLIRTRAPGSNKQSLK